MPVREYSPVDPDRRWAVEASVLAKVKKHYLELGIEFCLELAIGLYQLGAEQMDLPHNFWVGLGLWAVATALAIRMFWIFPWIEGWPRWLKILVAGFSVAVLIFFAWTPVRIAHGNWKRPLTGKQESTGDQISVVVGPDVDSQKVFETRFILTNNNPQALTEAGYVCTLAKNFIVQNSPYNMNQPANEVFAASGPIGNLPAGDSRSMYCDFSHADSHGDSLIRTVKDPKMVLEVIYKYENVQKDRSFLFFAKRRKDGTYVWLPGGAG